MLESTWATWLNRVGMLLEFVGLWLALVQYAAPHLRVFLASSRAPTGPVVEWLYRVLLEYTSLNSRKAERQWLSVALGFVLSLIGVVCQLVATF